MGLKVSNARRATGRSQALAALCLLALAGALLAGAGVPAARGAQALGAKLKVAARQTGAAKGAADAVRRARAGGDAKVNAQPKNGDRPLILGCTASPAETPITYGQTVNGTLASGDCTHPQDGSFYDAYTFAGTAGQAVTIRMNAAVDSQEQPVFDAYLYLVKPGETALSYATVQDDDGAGNTDSVVFAILPVTGTYTIMANSRFSGQTGAYTLSLRQNCSATPIASGVAVAGTLSATDCALPDGSFVDIYSFSANAGQQVSVSMDGQTFNDDGDNDTFLYLFGPDGYSVIALNDDASDATLDSRIPPGSGLGMLPATGTYYILANSFQPNTTGNYTVTLNLSQAVCPATTISPGQTLTGSLSTTDCRLLQDGSFLDRYTFTGAQGQQIAITMTATSTPALDTFLFLLDSNGIELAFDDNGGGGTNARIPATGGLFTLPRDGTYTILANASAPGLTGGYSLTLTGTNSPGACQVTIHPAVRPFAQPGGAGHVTVIPASPTCVWTASTTTPWITLSAPTSGTGTGRVRYTVLANNTAATRTGTIIIGDQTHTVTQTATGTTPSIAFSNAGFAVVESEGTLAIRISVSRTGDLTGAATVEFRTVDNPAAVPCNPQQTGERGTAYARCDYATAVDTLTFNQNEATKDFLIPLINDVHVEGPETFQIALSNPQGATLGATTTATVTIVDDDTAQPTTNPIRQNNASGYAFFVRQQYLDFLSREPDPAGFQAWVNLLTNCANPDNLDDNSPSALCDRILVSKSFLESPEFALKGRFVFLFHKAAFGSPAAPNFVPEYEQIVADMRRVTGATAEEVFAKRLDFADDFVARAAFTARYGALTPTQFVDTLLANVGATLATPDPNSGVTRNSLINDLTAGTKTRADVLRLIAEAREVNDLQFRHAYVAMQYYGYLRRTPEPGGYQNWLTFLNANPTAFRTMVNGFLNSTEYRWRFGPDL